MTLSFSMNVIVRKCTSSYLILRLLLLLLSVLPTSPCANQCSGKGKCTPLDLCECFEGYRGAPDCSVRSCSAGVAWADRARLVEYGSVRKGISYDEYSRPIVEPDLVDEFGNVLKRPNERDVVVAHSLSICSARGVCDGATGRCNCFPGWTGESCQFTVCPRQCSDSGNCMSMRQISKMFGQLRNPAPVISSDVTASSSVGNDVLRFGASKSLDYSNWDSDYIRGCVCDAGFFGADCSMVACPRGDDPITKHQQARSIKVSVSHPYRTLISSDTIKLNFEGQRATIRIMDDAPSIKASILSQMKNVDNVDVFIDKENFTFPVRGFEKTLPVGSTIHFYITFLRFKTLENNFFQHDGNPPLDFFFCDTTGTSNGLDAKALPSAETAIYDVQMVTFSTFRWRQRGPNGETGNFGDAFTFTDEAACDLKQDKTIVLRFNPSGAWQAGESWRVVVSSGLATVIPDTECIIEDTDLSISASGTYTSKVSTDITIEISSEKSSDGRNQYLWRTEGPNSVFAGPFPVNADQETELSANIFFKFGSAYGHTPGARFVVSGTAPVAQVISNRKASMTARGTANTTTSYYRIHVVDGKSKPNKFRFFRSTTGIPSEDDLFARPHIEMDAHGNYLMGPDGLENAYGNVVPAGSNFNPDTTVITPGNGVTVAFSSVIAFHTGMEWVVIASEGGAVTTVEQPDAPLTVDTSSIATLGNYTITMRSVGYSAQYDARGNLTRAATRATFDFVIRFQNGGVPQMSVTPIPVNDWYVGNALGNHGVTLMFLSAVGHAAGTSWTFNVGLNGLVTFISQPHNKLQVFSSGNTLSSRYFVRIKSSKSAVSGADEFEVSEDGGVFSGSYALEKASSATGNTELGNGLILVFNSNDAAGYAPGQLWEIRTIAPGIQVSTTPSLREFSMCSGRGRCSLSTGTCSCYDGFMGVDCSMVSNVLTKQDNSPGQLLRIENTLYTNDVLRLETAKSPSPDFYFIQAIAGKTRIFGVRGDGQVAVQLFTVDTITVKNGMSVEDGGLAVKRRGISVHSGGLDILDGGARVMQTSDANGLEVKLSSQLAEGVTKSVLYLESIEPTTGKSNDHSFLRMFSTTTPSYEGEVKSTTERFSVSGTGSVSIFSGGLHVLNPVPYNASGPLAAKADIRFGGADISGGLVINDYGLDIKNGGLNVRNAPRGAGGAYPGNRIAGSTQDVLVALAEDPDFNASVLYAKYTSTVPTGSATSDPSIFNLLRLDRNSNPVFSVDGTGFTHIRSGGARIDSGGLLVVNGGVEVVNSGVVIDNGGLFVRRGGARIAAGGGVISVSGQNYGALSLIQTGSGTYTETLLNLQADVMPSPNFNFIKASANKLNGGQTFFRVDGQGDIYLGDDGIGNARVRIAANGYIQTLSSDDINMEADEGQTIIVTAGDAKIVNNVGQVGSIVLRGGKGSGNIPGGDISITGGSATGNSGNGGNAIMQGGDNIATDAAATGYGGSVSIYPGHGIDDAHFGELRILDGKKVNRTVVLEVLPSRVVLNSGGDMSITAKETAQNFITIQAGGMISVAAGTSMLHRSTGIMSLFTEANLFERALGDLSLRGDNSATIESPLDTQLLAGDLASLFGANSLVLSSNGNIASSSGTTTSLYSGSNMMLQTANAAQLSLFGGLAINLNSPDVISAYGGKSILASAPTLLSLHSDTLAHMNSPVRVSLQAGSQLAGVSPNTVSLYGGNSVLLQSDKLVQAFSNDLVNLTGSNSVSINSPTSNGLISLYSGNTLVADSVITTSLYGGESVMLTSPKYIIAQAAEMASIYSQRSVLMKSDDNILASAGTMASIYATNSIQLVGGEDVFIYAQDFVSTYGFNSILMNARLNLVGLSGTQTSFASTGTHINAADAGVIDTSPIMTSLYGGASLMGKSDQMISFYSTSSAIYGAQNAMIAESIDMTSIMSRGNVLVQGGTNSLLGYRTGNVLIGAIDMISLYGMGSINFYSESNLVSKAVDQQSIMGGTKVVLSAANDIYGEAIAGSLSLYGNMLVGLNSPSLVAATSGDWVQISGANSIMIDSGIIVSSSSQYTSLNGGLSTFARAEQLFEVASDNLVSLYSGVNINTVTGSGDILDRAAGLASYYGGTSLAISSSANVFAHAIDMVSIYGACSVNSFGDRIVDSAIDMISLFGENSIVLKSGSANLGYVLLDALDYVSIFGGNSIFATAPNGVIAGGAGPTSLYGELSIVVASPELVHIESTGVSPSSTGLVSLFGTNSIYSRSNSIIDEGLISASYFGGSSVTIVAGAGGNVFVDPNVGGGSGLDGGSVHVAAGDHLRQFGSNSLTFFSSIFVGGHAEDYMSLYGVNSIHVASNSYMFASANELVSLYGVNSVALTSNTMLLDSAPFISVTGANSIVLTAPVISSEATDISSVYGTNEIHLLSNLAIYAEAELLSVYGGNSIYMTTLGNTIIDDLGMFSLYGGNSIMLTSAALDGAIIGYAAGPVSLHAAVTAALSSEITTIVDALDTVSVYGANSILMNSNTILSSGVSVNSVYGMNSVVLSGDVGVFAFSPVVISTYASGTGSINMASDTVVTISAVDSISESAVNQIFLEVTDPSISTGVIKTNSPNVDIHAANLISIYTELAFTESADVLSMYGANSILMTSSVDLVGDALQTMSFSGGSSLLLWGGINLVAQSGDTVSVSGQMSTFISTPEFFLDATTTISLQSAQSMFSKASEMLIEGTNSISVFGGVSILAKSENLVTDATSTSMYANSFFLTTGIDGGVPGTFIGTSSETMSFFSSNSFAFASRILSTGSSDDFLSFYGGNSLTLTSNGYVFGEAVEAISLYGANSIFLTTTKDMDLSASVFSLYGSNSLLFRGFDLVAEVDELVSIYSNNVNILTDYNVIVDAKESISMYGANSAFLKSALLVEISSDDTISMFSPNSLFIKNGLPTLSSSGVNDNSYLEIGSGGMTSISGAQSLMFFSPLNIMGASNSITFSAENLMALASNGDLTAAAVGMTSIYGNSLMFSSSLFAATSGPTSIISSDVMTIGAASMIAATSGDSISVFSEVSTHLGSNSFFNIDSRDTLIAYGLNSLHIGTGLMGVIDSADVLSLFGTTSLMAVSNDFMNLQAVNLISINGGTSLTADANTVAITGGVVSVTGVSDVNVISTGNIYVDAMTGYSLFSATSVDLDAFGTMTLDAGVDVDIMAINQIKLDAGAGNLLGAAQTVSMYGSNSLALTTIEASINADTMLFSAVGIAATAASLFSASGSDFSSIHGINSIMMDTIGVTALTSGDMVSLYSPNSLNMNAMISQVQIQDLVYTGTGVSLTSSNFELNSGVVSIMGTTTTEVSGADTIITALASVSLYSPLTQVTGIDVSSSSTSSTSFTASTIMALNSPEILLSTNLLTESTTGIHSITAGELYLHSVNLLSIYGAGSLALSSASATLIDSPSGPISIQAVGPGGTISIDSDVIQLNGITAISIKGKVVDIMGDADGAFLQSGGVTSIQALTSLMLSSNEFIQATSVSFNVAANSLAELTSAANIVLTANDMVQITGTNSLVLSTSNTFLQSSSLYFSVYSGDVLDSFSENLLTLQSNNVASLYGANSLSLSSPNGVIEMSSSFASLMSSNMMDITALSLLSASSTDIVSIYSANDIYIGATNNFITSSNTMSSIYSLESIMITGTTLTSVTGNVLELQGQNTVNIVGASVYGLASGEMSLYGSLFAASGTTVLFKSDETLLSSSVGDTSLFSAANAYLTGNLNTAIDSGGMVSISALNSILTSSDIVSIIGLTSLELQSTDISLISNNLITMSSVNSLLLSSNDIYASSIGYMSLAGATSLQLSSNGMQIDAVDIVNMYSGNSLYFTSGNTITARASGDVSIYGVGNTLVGSDVALSLYSAVSIASNAPAVTFDAGVNLLASSGGMISLNSLADIQVNSNDFIQTASVTSILGTSTTISGDTSLDLVSSSIIFAKSSQSLVLQATSFMLASSETLASIYSAKETSMVSDEMLLIQKTGLVGALSISSSADLDLVGDNVVFAAVDTMSLFGASGIEVTTTHMNVQADQLDLAAYSLVNITGAKEAVIYAVDLVNLGAGTNALKFFAQYTEFNSSMINFTATGELSMNGSTVRSYANDIVQFGSDKRVYFFSKELIDFKAEETISFSGGNSIILKSSDVILGDADLISLYGANGVQLLTDDIASIVGDTAVLLSSDSNVTVVAPDISLSASDSAIVMGGTSTLVSSDGAVAISGSTFNISGSYDGRMEGQNIEVSASSLLALNSTGNIALNSAGSISASSTETAIISSASLSLVGTSSAVLTAGSSMSLTASSLFSSANNIVANADGPLSLKSSNAIDISAQASTISATTVLAVIAGTAIDIDSDSTYIQAAQLLSLYGGDQTNIVSNSLLSSGNLVSLRASQKVELTSDLELNLLATSGVVSVAANNVNLNALQNVAVESAGSVSVTGATSITFSSSGPIISTATGKHSIYAGLGVDVYSGAPITLSPGPLDTFSLRVGLTSLQSATIVASSTDFSSVYGGNLFLRANSASSFESGDLLSLFASNNMMLSSNGLLALSAPALSLYGAASMLFAVNANLGLSAPDTASVYGGNAIALRSGNSFMLNALKATIDSSDFVSIHGSNSLMMRSKVVNTAADDYNVITTKTARLSSDVTSAIGTNSLVLSTTLGNVDISGVKINNIATDTIYSTANIISVYGAKSIFERSTAAAVVSSAFTSLSGSTSLHLVADTSSIGLGPTTIKISSSTGKLDAAVSDATVAGSSVLSLFGGTSGARLSSTGNIIQSSTGYSSIYSGNGLFMMSPKDFYVSGDEVSLYGSNSVTLGSVKDIFLSGVTRVSLSSSTGPVMATAGTLSFTGTSKIAITGPTDVISASTVTAAAGSSLSLFGNTQSTLRSNTATVISSAGVVSIVGTTRMDASSPLINVKADTELSLAGSSAYVTFSSSGLVASGASTSLLGTNGVLLSTTKDSILNADGAQSIYGATGVTLSSPNAFISSVASMTSLYSQSSMFLRTGTAAGQGVDISTTTTDFLVKSPASMSLLSGNMMINSASGSLLVSSSADLTASAGTSLSLTAASAALLSTTAGDLSVVATGGNVLNTAGNTFVVSGNGISLYSATDIDIVSSTVNYDVGAISIAGSTGATLASLGGPAEIISTNDQAAVRGRTASVYGQSAALLMSDGGAFVEGIMEVSLHSQNGVAAVSETQLLLRGSGDGISMFGLQSINVLSDNVVNLQGGTKIVMTSPLVSIEDIPGTATFLNTAGTQSMYTPAGVIALEASGTSSLLFTSGGYTNLDAGMSLFANAQEMIFTATTIDAQVASLVNFEAGISFFADATDIMTLSGGNSLILLAGSTDSLPGPGYAALTAGGQISMFSGSDFNIESNNNFMTASQFSTSIKGSTINLVSQTLVAEATDSVSIFGAVSIASSSPSIDILADQTLSLYGANSVFLRGDYMGLLSASFGDAIGLSGGNSIYLTSPALLLLETPGQIAMNGQSMFGVSTMGNMYQSSSDMISIFGLNSIGMGGIGLVGVDSQDHISLYGKQSIYVGSPEGSILSEANNIISNTDNSVEYYAQGAVILSSGSQGRFAAVQGLVFTTAQMQQTASTTRQVSSVDHTISSVDFLSLYGGNSLLLGSSYFVSLGAQSINQLYSNDIISMYSLNSIEMAADYGIEAYSSVYMGLSSGDLTSVMATNSLLLSAGNLINVESQDLISLYGANAIGFSSNLISSRSSGLNSIFGGNSLVLGFRDKQAIPATVIAAMDGDVNVQAPGTLSLFGDTALALNGDIVRLYSPLVFASGATLSSSFTYQSSSVKMCTITKVSRPLWLVTATEAASCSSTVNGVISTKLLLLAPASSGVVTGASFTIVNSQSSADIMLKVDTWLDGTGPSFIIATIKEGGSMSFIAMASRWTIVSAGPAFTSSSPLVHLQYFAGNPSRNTCFVAADCP
jgi:hypothetical protein